MDGTSPTRMNLLIRRSQLRLAVRGVDLLQKKRDALVTQFFSLVHETLDARKRLNAAGREAHIALFVAKAFEGPREVGAIAAETPVVPGPKVKLENVWGIRVPRLAVDWPAAGFVSPLGMGTRTLAAQIAFRTLLQALIQVANMESRLRHIGEEIKKTARRVNALEQVVIPAIQAQIHSIREVLDQHEQEDIFRLKRIKGRVTGGRG